MFATTVILLCLSTVSHAGESTDVETYSRRGFELQERGDYKNALRNFDAAIQMYPKNPRAYYHRGNFYIGETQCARALEDFNAAVRLKPTWWWAINARAGIYLAMGKCDLALADYNKILSLNPGPYMHELILNNRAWLEATCRDARFRNGQKALADAKLAYSYNK